MAIQVNHPRNKKPLPKGEIPVGVKNPSDKKISIVTMLNQAQRRVPDARKSTYVHVKKYEVRINRTGNYSFKATTITRDPNEPPSRDHYVEIYAKDKNYRGKLYRCPSVMFDCSCSRWLYTWEYAAWHKGAATLLRCNGEYPEATNPGLLLGLCKHAISSSLFILNRKL